MALHGAACRSNRSGWGDMLALGNVATWRQGSTWFHVRICFVSNFQGMRWRYGQIFFAVKSQTTWKPRRKAEYRIQIAARHGARGNCTNPNTNTTVRIHTYIYIYYRYILFFCFMSLSLSYYVCIHIYMQLEKYRERVSEGGSW